MNIFTAPIYSLFSLNFYREVIRAPLSRGMLYLTYLSGLAVPLALLFLSLRVFPQMDQFMDWARGEMPALMWTEGRLVMNAESPYTMTHPQLGPLVSIDTSKTDVSTEVMGESAIFVTSNKIYVREGQHETRVYDLSKLVEQYREEGRAAAPRDVTLDADFLEKIYRSVKPVIVLVILFLVFPLFFVWNLFMALIYSGLGALLNLFRSPHLPYSAVLNAALFGMTASLVIAFLQILVPYLNRIPFGFFGGLLVTGIYLFLAIKKTEGEFEMPGTFTEPE